MKEEINSWGRCIICDTGGKADEGWVWILIKI